MKTPIAVAMDVFDPALTPRQNMVKAIEADRAQRVSAEFAWRDGYFTGKRDYAASITGGRPIATPNPHAGGDA